MRLWKHNRTVVELGINRKFFTVGWFNVTKVRDKAPAGIVRSCYIFLIPCVYIAIHTGYPKPKTAKRQKRTR